GTRRARAMAVLLLSLPGAAFLYAGQELGLPEVTDLPDSALRDPAFRRSGGAGRGRDGCRVPLPWSGTAPPFGFSTTGRSWLPVPADWGPLSVAEQERDEGSTLALYRDLLRLRRAEPAMRGGAVRLLDADPQVVRMERRAPGVGTLLVVLNLGAQPVPLPHGEILASSVPDAVTDSTTGPMATDAELLSRSVEYGPEPERLLAGDAAVLLRLP
uniref:alpha-amylase family glycosyl hydrolase n=1 Tax=Actinotalea sp. TaxID=1872145 RepID=UPI0035682FAF